MQAAIWIFFGGKIIQNRYSKSLAKWVLNLSCVINQLGIYCVLINDDDPLNENKIGNDYSCDNSLPDWRHRVHSWLTFIPKQGKKELMKLAVAVETSPGNMAMMG